MTRSKQARAAVAAATVCAGLVTGCGGVARTAGVPKENLRTGTLTVMYSQAGMFNTPQLGAKWWGTIKRQFQAANPGATLKLDPIAGTDSDMQTEAAFALRSPQTSPDVLAVETTTVGDLVQSGYLRNLTSYVDANQSFWPSFPKSIKAMSTVNGGVYSVNIGNNVSQFLYNKSMLRRAGIALPWHPRTWQDVLAAALKVKAAHVAQIPLYLNAGVAMGPFSGVTQAIGNLIVGSTTPEIFDPSSKKWVVDSPGLRAALQFYKSAFGDGLAPPNSVLLNAKAPYFVAQYLQNQKAAIVLASNWVPSMYAYKFALPWPQAGQEVGVAPIPTEYGGGAGKATTIAGWSLVVARSSTHAYLAQRLIDTIEKSSNIIQLANSGGFLPPREQDAASPAFTSFAPPQGEMKSYARFATPMPSTSGFLAYARAINTATGDIASDPATSIDDLIATIKREMNSQLGANQTTTIH